MSNSRLLLLRRKAPQIIVAAIIIVIAVFIVIELLEDILIEGDPTTNGPLISVVVSFTLDVKETVSSWGYLGIFGLMLLESSSLPVPSEVVLPFAGYIVSIGRLNFWLTVVVATVSAILGSLVDYYIGLKGVQLLTKRRVLGKAFFSLNQLEIAAKWFYKYGSLMIFLGRLIPGVRTLISFPAGAVKMSLTKFVVFTTAGCILWNTMLIYVGYYLGINWAEVASVSHYIIIGVIVALAMLLALYLVARRKKKIQNRQHSR